MTERFGKTIEGFELFTEWMKDQFQTPLPPKGASMKEYLAVLSKQSASKAIESLKESRPSKTDRATRTRKTPSPPDTRSNPFPPPGLHSGEYDAGRSLTLADRRALASPATATPGGGIPFRPDPWRENRTACLELAGQTGRRTAPGSVS